MARHLETKEVSKNNNKSNKKNMKKKRKRIVRIILLILLILIIASGIFIGVKLANAPEDLSFTGKLFYVLFGHDENTRENLDKLQVLILGESTGNSDTIIVASYDPKTQEASLLSIPRDTRVEILDDNGYVKSARKINSLYSAGETPERTLEAVNELTGLNIQYYIIVDTEALIKLVDIIGGLEFDVPIDMNYDDGDQNLHIHLSAGYQKLSGEQVEQLVRFRHNNNGSTYPYSYGWEDYGRMKTQRDVIVALAKQTLQFKNITEIFNIIDVLKEYVRTNLNLDNVKDYVPYAVDMNMENVKVQQLPGSDDYLNGINYFFPDEEETKTVVDELFFGITKTDPEEEGNNTTENNTISDDE